MELHVYRNSHIYRWKYVSCKNNLSNHCPAFLLAGLLPTALPILLIPIVKLDRKKSGIASQLLKHGIMAELPENLQIVKTEGPQLPETEAQPRRLIKERLNLHVKRRLQQEQEPQAQTQQQLQIITHPSGNIARETVAITAPQQSPQSANVNVNSIENDVTASTSTSKRKEKQQQKEPVKTRRPYQKRVDKNTTKIQTQTQIIEDGGKSRKNKRHKQQGTFFGTAAGPSGSAGVLCLSPGVEEGSAGGGDEVDGRDMYSRDKEKCPDILGMVLSGKKRSLMQNAEVKEFLAKIMTAFKN